MQWNPAKMARPVHADGRRYVPAIDGLRCLAAWGVISAHIGSEFGPSVNLVSYYGSAAYPALIVFFTISGFLVYRPFARAALAPHTTPKKDRSTNFWVYLLRRVLRIFPLYWTVLAIAVIWNGPAGLRTPVDWFQAIFLVPIPDPMKLLAGPLGIAMWTLAIELPFYVLVPLYSRGLKALRARVAPDGDVFHFQVACVSVVIAVIAGLGLAFGGALAFPVMSLPIGMLFALLETRQALARRRYPVFRVMATYWWACVIGYVVLVFASAHLFLGAFHDRIVDLTSHSVAIAAGLQGAAPAPTDFDPLAVVRDAYFPLQLALALLLFIPVAFGGRRSLLVRAMASTPLQMLAPLTYGVYLWHVPLIRHTQEWFGRGFLGFPVPGTTGFGMPTVFMALGLAIITFVCVELPAAKLRERVDAWSRGHAASAGTPEPAVAAMGAADTATTATALDDDAWEPGAAPQGDGAVEPVDSEDDVELGEVGAAADLLVEDVLDRNPHVAEAEAEYARMHGRLRQAGASDTPQVTAQWCEPIDGFRAICACLAVAGHTFLASGVIPFGGALHVMGILVALFFAISAFVLYQPFIEADARGIERPQALSFYARRLLRIYPLFAFALTMYLIVLPEVRPDNFFAYVRLYFFLQIFGHELAALKGMPAAWYLCNEVIFYLLMPVMAYGAARWSNRHRVRKPADRVRTHFWIGMGMVFFGPLLRTLLYAADVPQPTSLPLSHLEFFGIGVIIASCTVGVRLGVKPPSFFVWARRNTTLAYGLVLIPVAALAAIAAIWGDGTGLWKDGNLEDRLRFFPYVPAVLLLMSAAALGPRANRSNVWLSHKRFKPLSALALHIYLWHQFVLGVINLLLPHGIGDVDLGPRWLTGLVLVAMALGGTIAVAWVSQPFTDWPYEQYRKRKGMLRPGAVAPGVSGRGAGAGSRPVRAG